jgi:pimeloyl-ACP methyl ester carboxylesterase
MSATNQKKKKWVGWIFAVPTLFLFGWIAFIWSRPPPKDIGLSPDLVETQFFDVEGVGKVAYWKVSATAPKRASYPMVYLAGGPGAGIGKFEALSFSRRYPDFDIYFLEQISVGASERLTRSALTINNSVAAINQFSTRVIKGPAVFVGGSWGAAIAAHFTTAHPDQVHALLLSSPAKLSKVCRVSTAQKIELCYEDRTPQIDSSLEPYPIERVVVTNGAAKTIKPSAPVYIPNGTMVVKYNRLHLAHLIAGFSSTLSEIVLPLNNRRLWEAFGLNTQVNVLLKRQHITTQITTSHQSDKIPSLILRGSLDYIPISGLGGYQVLFPNNRTVELKSETHNIDFEHCAPTIEVRNFLAQHAGAAQLKSCKNRLVPVPEMPGGYTLNTDLTF